MNKNAHVSQYCEENVDELRLGEQQVEIEGRLAHEICAAASFEKDA